MTIKPAPIIVINSPLVHVNHCSCVYGSFAIWCGWSRFIERKRDWT